MIYGSAYAATGGRTYVCRGCRNETIGEPFCPTCGAQKLYDTTLKTAEHQVAVWKAAAFVEAQRADDAEAELAKWKAPVPDVEAHVAVFELGIPVLNCTDIISIIFVDNIIVCYQRGGVD